MITIFSIPKSFNDSHINTIQRNAISSWKRIANNIQIILFGDEPGIEEIVKEYNVEWVKDIKKNENGTPYINFVFKKAQEIAKYEIVCFVNCDIIFINDFIKIVDFIKDNRLKNYLLIGRRTNINITEKIDFENSLSYSRLLEKVEKEGELIPPGASDYFIFRKGTIRNIPDLLVGRGFWDIWMIEDFITRGVKVIDATNFILSIHQNHNYDHIKNKTGNNWAGPETEYNFQFLKNKNYIYTYEDVKYEIKDNKIEARKNINFIKNIKRFINKYKIYYIKRLFQWRTYSNIIKHKIVRKILEKRYQKNPSYFIDLFGQDAHNYIFEMLNKNRSLLIGRVGAVELSCIFDAVDIFLNIDKKCEFKTVSKMMKENAGFFSADNREDLLKFSTQMLEIMKNIDIYPTLNLLDPFFKKILKNAKKIDISNIEPFFVEDPWTKYLEGKKVLVIHPFKDSIEYQLKRKDLWLKNKKWLPDCEIKIIKAIQSIAGNKPDNFDSWFDALEYMKNEIVKKGEFDIAIIGCGAYGLFLGDFIKKLGKQAIVMGDVTQLLFGIKGSRWEDPNYNNGFYIKNVLNEHWIKPLDSDRPKGFEKVENGCYW